VAGKGSVVRGADGIRARIVDYQVHAQEQAVRPVNVAMDIEVLDQAFEGEDNEWFDVRFRYFEVVSESEPNQYYHQITSIHDIDAGTMYDDDVASKAVLMAVLAWLKHKGVQYKRLD
jgi:hypothetical protein